MKTVISATLLVVLSVSASSVFAQQPADQKSKPAGDRAMNQSSTTALSTAELAPVAPKTDRNNVPAIEAEAQKYYETAIALAGEGRLVDAIAAFKRSLKLRPDDLQTNYSLGLAYAKSKLFKEAFESFKRVTRLKEDWPEGHFQLGLMSLVLEKQDQAKDEYKKLLKLNSPLASILDQKIKSGVSAGDAEERVSNNGITNSDTVPAAVKVSANNENKTEAVKNTVPAAVKVSANNENETEALKNPAPSKATSPESRESLSEIYRVGVGDVLDIRLLNSASGRSTLFTVIAGGLIELPVAGGPISVGGLTVEEIQNRISMELKRRAVDDGKKVSVGIRQYASHSVIVTGFVVNPGTKFLRREAVPLYVLLAESQLRNDAGRVVIKRSGATAFDLSLSESASMNINVLPGDVITVSGKQQEFYYIAGRVNYPGQKVFQTGITLLQAILAAGGTQRNSDVIEISREGADSRLVTTRFKIKEIKAGRSEDPKLQAGDRIEVLN